ncbi:MAG: hypothetical protein QME70_06550 [Bacillota bacterium]|nr:hypothetical protein [Bacillota bacterium]
METLPDWLQELMRLPEGEARKAIDDLVAERTAEAAQRLRLVEEAGSPALRKEARRALYRLRAAGVEIPPPRPGQAAVTPTRALISWVDRDGYLMVACVVDRPSGGARLVQAVVGDEGMVRAQAGEVSAGQLRRIMRELQTRPGMVECPVPYVQRVVTEAASRGMPDDPEQRAQADAVVRTVGRPAGEVPHPAYGVLDALAVKWDPDLLAQTPRLLETEEMAGWALPAEGVEGWGRRYEETASSPLVLDAATQRARNRELMRDLVREVFPPEALPAWCRRLEDMAYYFYRRQEERNARLALAAALALGGGQDRPAGEATDHPFLLALAEKTLREWRQQKEAGEEGARIVVPGR